MQESSALSFPCPHAPAPAEMTQVAPGIHWIRMPLPFALNHVNLWALEDGEGWTLIDAGLFNGPTQTLWRTLLAGALRGKPVKRLIVTHYHPDHAGCASWLVRETGATFMMSRTEILRAGTLGLDTAFHYRPAVADFYRRADIPAKLQEDMLGSGSNAYARNAEPPPLPYSRLSLGNRIDIGGRIWEVLIGQGHSPEMLCLFAPGEKILIAADQILPQISPNVSVFADQPEANPLAEFLSSLLRFRILPEDTLVLPGHGLPFYGLWQRLDSLQAHHRDRIESAWKCASRPCSAYDVMRALFPRALDSHQSGFALGETLAHINYLTGVGRLERFAPPAGGEAGGAWTYRQKV